MKLEKIQRRAETLGFTAVVRNGYLVISKRDDPTLFFISVHSLDDFRTLQEAAIWLEKQGNIQYKVQLMRESVERFQRIPERRKILNGTITIGWLLALQVADVWSLYLHFLPTGLGVIVLLVLIYLFVQVISNIKRRAIRGK